MILTEPLDERQIQELHSNYHDLEALADALRQKIRREKTKRRDMAQELARYIDQYEQCASELRKTRSVLYRATAPTASLEEGNDREAAIREGYAMTRPLGGSDGN